MALILNIDTALDTASICIADGETMISFSENNQQKDHAAWLHTEIAAMLTAKNLTVQNLQAIAVNIGPGSYTGLRVGLAAAKGFCFALQIPLITVSSLQVIALAAQQEAISLIRPMIDARRMEVYTALYDKDLNELEAPQAVILNENSFQQELQMNKILFCGNGSNKFLPLVKHNTASFSNKTSNASHLSILSYKKFTAQHIANIAYTEPSYIKEFYSVSRKQ
jgi:tRNA threonylcarbamoyladenosine biosynthesis protein TsaB